jgi:hypothetical protein
MKSGEFRAALIAVSIAFISVWAPAATVISYTASDEPNASPDGNGNTVNVWTMSFGPGDSSDRGSFIANSANNGDGNGAGAGNPAWGIYANGDDNSSSTASHTFAGGALFPTQTVSIDFDNGYVDTGSDVGLRLLSGSGTEFYLNFIGGNAEGTYKYGSSGDGFISHDTGKSFTDDGFNVAVTITTATTFSAVIGGFGPFTGSFGSAITRIEVYNQDAGPGSPADVFFNNLAVVRAGMRRPNRHVLLRPPARAGAGTRWTLEG